MIYSCVLAHINLHYTKYRTLARDGCCWRDAPNVSKLLVCAVLYI